MRHYGDTGPLIPEASENGAGSATDAKIAVETKNGPKRLQGYSTRSAWDRSIGRLTNPLPTAITITQAWPQGSDIPATSPANLPGYFFAIRRARRALAERCSHSYLVIRAAAVSPIREYPTEVAE